VKKPPFSLVKCQFLVAQSPFLTIFSVQVCCLATSHVFAPASCAGGSWWHPDGLLMIFDVVNIWRENATCY
jgi:hypothetical protein